MDEATVEGLKLRMLGNMLWQDEEPVDDKYANLSKEDDIFTQEKQDD